MNQSFQEFTNGKYTTPEMVESLERATRYANLQIAIERVLCTYINETDASERLPITQIDFEHHGARVSVKVEIGDAAVRVERDKSTVAEHFRIMQALAGLSETPVQAYDRLTRCDETCKAGCQCGRCETCKSETNEYDTSLAGSHGMTLGQLRHLMHYHPTSGKGEDEIWQKREETLACNDPLHFEMDWDGREFIKSTVLDETFHEHAEELRIELQRELNRLFFPSLTFSVSYHNVHNADWQYEFTTILQDGKKYTRRSQSIDGTRGVNPGFVQWQAREVLEDFRKQCKQVYKTKFEM